MAKKVKTSTTKNEVVTEKVVEQPAAETEVVADAPSLMDDYAALLNDLTSLRSTVSSLTNQLRALKTRTERELRQAHKDGKRRKNVNRKPSGFVKPTPISSELAKFLNKPKDTQMARTEVTREINQYILTNNLQDPQNRRRIVPNSELRKLLKIAKGEELTYFNLQRYMSPHFKKATASA